MTGLDWLIAAALLAFLVGVVIWSRSLVKDVSSFLVAGRKQRMWLGLSNNNSAGLGLGTLAYLCQEGYRNGFAIMWITLLQTLVAIVLFGLIGFGIERFRASKVMTGGQFHEMRYSRGVRLLVGLAMGIGGVINMAAFPVVGGLFIIHFLGWNESFTVGGMTLPTLTVVAGVMIFFGVFFAAICGQVGVVVTDYIQGIVIMIGMFAITWLVFKDTGVSKVHDVLIQEKGEAAFNPYIAGSYGFLWAIWIFITAVLGPFSFAPHMSKNASADNPKVVRKISLISCAFSQGKSLMMLALGVGAFVAVGQTLCPESMSAANYEKIVAPMYIGSLCPPILKGLLLSAFLFAAISTYDTYIMAWSSVWVNDVYCVLRKKPLSPKAHIWAVQLCIVLVGIFLCVWGLGVMNKLNTTILAYLMLTGTIFSGAGIAMIAGLYWKRASTAGAYAAVITGMTLPLIDLVLRRTECDFYKVSPVQAGVFTILAAIVLLVVISLSSKKPTKWIDYGTAVRESEKND